MLIASIFLQLIILLFAAPLLTGIIKKTKALLQCRRGPSIFQPYYDLAKYWRKETVISEHASWIFTAAPVINFAAVATAGLMIPIFLVSPSLGLAGDAIAVLYALALGRFFLALAGLDAGHAFGGMASSREMALSALAEPAIMIPIFALALTSGSTNLGSIVRTALDYGGVRSPAYALAFLGMMIVLLAETGRIPVDNPDTHLELTMIHEGMLLEYTGPNLALMHWAASVKQLLFLSLLANVFFPWGIAAAWQPTAVLIAAAVYLLKVLCLAVLIAVIETSTAKMRLFRVPELLGLSCILSFLAAIMLF